MSISRRRFLVVSSSAAAALLPGVAVAAPKKPRPIKLYGYGYTAGGY